MTATTQPLHILRPAGGSAMLWLTLAATAAALALLPAPWAVAVCLGTTFMVALLLNPVLGLYALAALIPFGPVLRVPAGPATIGVTDLLVAATAAAWFIRQTALRTPLRSSPLLMLFVPLSLVLLFTTLPAQSLESAAPELVKWVEVVVVYFLATQLISRRHRLPLALVLIGAAAVESLVGLRQFAFGIGPEAYQLGSFLRAYGTFGQPNPFAGYLGLVLPLALALALAALSAAFATSGRQQAKSLLLAAYALGITIVLAAGILASWSRGAWLGAAAAAIAVLVLSSRGGRLLVVGIAAVAFLTLPLLPASVSERLADFGRYFGTWNARGVPVNDANFSVLERVAHWQVSWEMLADHPWLGIGIGNWDLVYGRYAFGQWTEPMGHAHNALFHFAAESGLAGAVAYLWLWLGALVASLRAVRRSSGLERGLAVGVTGLFVHLSVHNQFENLFVQGMPLLVALALALLCTAPQARPVVAPTHA